MKGIIEIFKRDGLDPKSVSKEGSFEQREYGRIYTPASVNNKKNVVRLSDNQVKSNDAKRHIREVRYFSPYIH